MLPHVVRFQMSASSNTEHFSIFRVYMDRSEGGAPMKKRSLAAMIGCFVVICAAAMAFSGQKPYRNLKAADIVSASVHLAPPDKALPVPDVEALAAYLREVVIYRKDNSYVEYTGQAVIFTLTMSDGSQEEIVEYNPFVVINGTGYRAKYEPCEALNRYANRLLSEAG